MKNMSNSLLPKTEEKKKGHFKKNRKTDLQPVLWQNEMLYDIYFPLTCPGDVSSTTVHSGLCHLRVNFCVSQNRRFDG